MKLLINLRNPNFLKIAINNLENFSTEKLRFIFEECKRKSRENQIQNSFEKLIYLSCSFKGQMTLFDPRIIPGLLKKLKTNGKLYSNQAYSDIKFISEDYKIILNKFKNCSNVFLYLDPPYLGGSVKSSIYNGKNFSIDDYIFIANYMCESKCKVLLHVEYAAIFTEILSKNLEINSYPFSFTSTIKNNNKYPHWQTMLRNYKV